MPIKENKNAITVSLCLPHFKTEEFNEEIEELKQLSLTLGYKIHDNIIQNRPKIDSATYIGKGKLNSLVNICSELNVKTLIFNNELSPSHYKNINKISKDKLRIIDRTKLILDIFNDHAKTNEAKKQIELATLQYMLPRLTGLWTHLERQMGGIGTRGGPGEKQIEIDKRIIRKSITKLKKDLKNIHTQRKTQRKNRHDIYKISLVGYTNAGKSTLMKELSGFNVLIKDQLFATLDTTTKLTVFKKKYKALLSDTVGFLSNLPHNLIASFKSTLEEIDDADLIIKVIDINHSNIEHHINTIDQTLNMLNIKNKKSILVFNKIDRINNIDLFKSINSKYKNPIMISSLKSLKINLLIDKIVDIMEENTEVFDIEIPKGKYKMLTYLHSTTNVIDTDSINDNIIVKIRTTTQKYNSIIKYINNKNP